MTVVVMSSGASRTGQPSAVGEVACLAAGTVVSHSTTMGSELHSDHRFNPYMKVHRPVTLKPTTICTSWMTVIICSNQRERLVSHTHSTLNTHTLERIATL